MSSFFLKNKPKSATKRKFEPAKSSKQSTPKYTEEDDEINSDDAFDSAEEDGDGNSPGNSTDEDLETQQDKRLRLSTKYLEEIIKKEASHAEDKELHDLVSKRLHDDYLDSVGKLRKSIADSIAAPTADSVKVLKHKTQKLSMTALAISSDKQFFFSGAKSNIVVKWDMQTLRPVGTLDVHPYTEDADTTKKRRSHVVAMALSSDFKFLAIAEGGNNIQIWCPSELTHLKTFKGHRDIVHSLVFRKDTHELYSACKDRSVKIWSLDEMAYVESLFGHQAGITSIDALSRERALTAGGIDCSVRIWKITEESQLIYNGHNGSIEHVKFLNDEHFLSAGVDGSLCLWSALKKKPQHIETLTHGSQPNGDPNWITALTSIVNTDLVASGSSDGQIRLWKVSENGRKLSALFTIPVPGFVNSLAFTSDGSHLLVAVGQEHRLGRWWRNADAKNSVVVIKLNKKNSS